MTQEPIRLQDNDVIRLEKLPTHFFIKAKTFLGCDFWQAFYNHIISTIGAPDRDLCDGLFQDGINCELLRPNETWQNVKLKISIEFIPEAEEESQREEAEEVENRASPLDEIRKMAKE
jgi:KGK domain